MDPTGQRIERVSGHRDLLERLPDLLALTALTSQRQEVEELPYFFSRPQRLRPRPHLVLIHSATKLQGAVLLYTFAGGLYSTLERHGYRSVFGPVEHRVDLAQTAIQSLLEQGARFVNINFDMGPLTLPATSEDPAYQAALLKLKSHPASASLARCEWALHNGAKPMDMALQPNFDETLAIFGKKTRKNFRYYRNLCVHELGCTFVPNVEIERETFLTLSRHSHYPISQRQAAWRFDTLNDFPNTVLSGMQDRHGNWISLIGFRRKGTEVVIDWQINRKGYERFSLSTAMRAFLMQHEGAHGSTRLSVEPGTTHEMSKYFDLRSVYNLAGQRKGSLWVRGVGWGIRRLRAEHPLSVAIHKPWRRWNDYGQPNSSQ